ncbi:MAG: chemotaxis protein CheW [Bacteroidales bacterium]
METNSVEILSFTLDSQRFALPLSTVERVLRALAVTHIPDAPPIVYGVIDYYGEIIAVINLRSHLKLTPKDVYINDRFIVVKTSGRKLALVVDEVESVMKPLDKDISQAEEINSGLKIAKMIRDNNGIIFIYDLEKLLNCVDEIQLDELLMAEQQQ